MVYIYIYLDQPSCLALSCARESLRCFDSLMLPPIANACTLPVQVMPRLAWRPNEHTDITQVCACVHTYICVYTYVWLAPRSDRSPRRSLATPEIWEAF